MDVRLVTMYEMVQTFLVHGCPNQYRAVRGSEGRLRQKDIKSETILVSLAGPEAGQGGVTMPTR
jgi:hypothetical protein